MGTITMIPAKRRIGSRVVQDEVPKTRVAAYCRVSTDTDEQATSYEAQVEHYTEYIKKNPAWECAGIYADDGISGTNTKKREEFNRLIDDCMNGKVDMVVTKSISRFARNTLDCLNYIRKLKDKNIAVYFEKEGINTLDAKGEVMLTIMASLAQQESESLSQNVRLGLQYRYQQGKVLVNHNRFLGYDKDEEGNLIINKEEAEVVKRIFREYLEGQSFYGIGKGLEADGIKTAAGSSRWLNSSIKLILTNEKYMGDALLQKTITTDFLTKKRVANRGIVPSGWQIAVSFRNTMWKITMKPSFRRNFLCGFRRKCRKGQGLKPQRENADSTAVSLLFQILLPAAIAEVFISELTGIFMAERALCGGAFHGSSRNTRRLNATPVLLRNRNFRPLQSRQSMRSLPNRTVICLS